MAFADSGLHSGSLVVNVQQINLVRSTFALVQPIASDAAALFYDNLFGADPRCALSSRAT